MKKGIKMVGIPVLFSAMMAYAGKCEKEFARLTELLEVHSNYLPEIIKDNKELGDAYKNLLKNNKSLTDEQKTKILEVLKNSNL